MGRTNKPRIQMLIEELNNISEQRKTLMDRAWVLETLGEQKRIELMQLLNGQQK